MKTKMILITLALTASFSAFAGNGENPLVSSAASVLAGPALLGGATSETVGTGPGLGGPCKEIVEIAADDIATFRATGEMSGFLHEAIKRISVSTKQTPDKVVQAMIQEADQKMAQESAQSQR